MVQIYLHHQSQISVLILHIFIFFFHSDKADEKAEIEKKIRDDENRVVREEELKEIMKKVDNNTTTPETDADVDMLGKNS